MTSLFSPLQIGTITLDHRVIMAPLTRFRAPESIPNDLMVKYYSQRASKGGLIISESVSIHEKCGLPRHFPRIDTQEAIDGWKPIVKAVHDKNGFMFCQLNHLGRAAKGNKFPVYSSSDIPIAQEGYPIPLPMDRQQMNMAIDYFCQAAANAMEAGFDGIEIHGANGYLIDQFLEDNINTRTDEYGGSIENRCRFPLQVLDLLIDTIGSDKIGFRISPWDVYLDANDSNPMENFTYVCQQLEKRNLAYVHIIEARSDANGGRENDDSKANSLSSDLVASSAAKFKSSLPTTPLLSAGGWNKSNYKNFSDIEVDGLVFGRPFIANPDLPYRLKKELPLNDYERKYFYSPLIERGYIDYPEWEGVSVK